MPKLKYGIYSGYARDAVELLGQLISKYTFELHNSAYPPPRFLHILLLLLTLCIPAGASFAEDTPAGPVCSGFAWSGCWQEIANLPGCQVWNPGPQEEETVTWSGGCVGGRASGPGQLTWSYKRDGQSKTSTSEGLLIDGRQHGHWVIPYAEGGVGEGTYIDGKLHGHWVIRYASGHVLEGPYVDDYQHGHWVIRYADGRVSEGPYVDGKRHGHWVERYPDGTVYEGPYVDGERVASGWKRH